MTVPNRAALITKTHKVLKKHYQPIAPPSERTLLEHLLYACCLENAPNEAADEAFAKLQEMYFDWNEVRVTTVTELAETMDSLPEPKKAATRLKQTLQSVFESHYAFDIDSLKKENIGAAVKKLEKYNGTTPFAVSYVTQASLGGHSIGADQGVINTLYVLGVISETEAKNGRVPGMERAIPKTRGVEFASLLHQLGADFHSSPYSTRVRSILTEIASDAKERWPKRGAKKAEPDEPKREQKRTKRSTAKSPDAKKPTGRVTQSSAKRKPANTKKAPGRPKKKSAASSKANGAKKKSPTKRLAKKKPR